MPRGLSEEMVMVMGLLFLFVIQMIVRLIGAARRRRQGLGPRARAPGPERPLPDEAQEPALVQAPPPAPPPAAAPMQPELGMQPLAKPTAPALPIAQPDLHSTRRPPGRLQRLTPWQQAVVWAEIIGPPRGQDGEPPLS